MPQGEGRRCAPSQAAATSHSASVGTFGMNFQITTALMASVEFHQGPKEFGLLGSVMAVGSLAAALLSARRPRARTRTFLLALPRRRDLVVGDGERTR